MPPLTDIPNTDTTNTPSDHDLSARDLMRVLSGDDTTTDNSIDTGEADDHIDYQLPGTPPKTPQNDEQLEDTNADPAQETEEDPNQAQDPSDPNLRHILQQYRTTLIPAMERDLQTAQTRVQELENERQGYQQYTQSITQYGLNPQEAILGLQLAAGYKLNPAETIRRLIASATANGIQLAPDTPNIGLDAASVASIVQQQLAPIMGHFTQQRQQQEQATQRQAELQRTVNNFFAQFPDARIHEDAIAGVIQANPGMDLTRAYYETRMWAQGNGLDWNKPLVPQLQAKAQRANGNANPQPSLGNRRTLQPGMTMRSASDPVKDADKPWRQIIDEAVQAARNGEG